MPTKLNNIGVKKTTGNTGNFWRQLHVITFPCVCVFFLIFKIFMFQIWILRYLLFKFI